MSEQHVRKRLSHMIVCFALCWLPLQVLVVVTHLVYQTDDEPAFDIAYAVLLLVALMSPLTTAIIARPIIPRAHPARAPPSYLRRWRYYRKKAYDVISGSLVNANTLREDSTEKSAQLGDVNIVVNDDVIDTWSVQSAPSQVTNMTSLERGDSQRASTCSSHLLQTSDGHLLAPGDAQTSLPSPTHV